jgi:hypothetical protein
MERHHLEDILLNVEGRMFVKYTLKKQNMRCSLGSPGSRKDTLSFSSGHGNESSGSIKDREASREGYFSFNLILFAPSFVTLIKPYSNKCTQFTLTLIFQTHELLYTFQQRTAILREALHRNLNLIG